jgi:EAL and modified HD-GYP domain-containing signal transduction protein
VAAAADAALPVARRLLIDRDGRLAGFEFPVPDVMGKRLAQGADDRVVSAHARALLAALQPTVDAGRVAMATLPAGLLAREGIVEQVPPKAWLVVSAESLPEPPPPWWGALTDRGVRLGVEQVPHRRAWFVRVDCSALDRDAAIAAVMACREAAPRARIVASQMADVDDVEAVLRAGADLASGRHEHMRQVPQGATLSPAMVQVQRLMNQVLHDAELSAIADGIRADVGLSYELLRYANSPLLGLSQQIDSVDSAVMLLGRDALFRWLCARLLAASKGRSAARALQEIALARALLFERLAPAGDAPPSTLFTLGLLSLLDVMVPMPMAAAVAPLGLPQDVRDALVDRSGPWASLLTLAQSLERGDIAGAEPAALQWGGIDEAAAAAEKAWAAAAEASASVWAP